MRPCYLQFDIEVMMAKFFHCLKINVGDLGASFLLLALCRITKYLNTLIIHGFVSNSISHLHKNNISDISFFSFF